MCWGNMIGGAELEGQNLPDCSLPTGQGTTQCAPHVILTHTLSTGKMLSGTYLCRHPLRKWQSCSRHQHPSMSSQPGMTERMSR